MLCNRDTRQGRLAGRIPIGFGYEFQISKFHAHIIGRFDSERQSRGGDTHGGYVAVESHEETNGSTVTQVFILRKNVRFRDDSRILLDAFLAKNPKRSLNDSQR